MHHPTGSRHAGMLAVLLTACGGTSPEGTGAGQPAESGGAAGQTTGAGATTTAATGAGSGGDSGAAGGAGAGGATSSGTGGAGGAPVDPGSMTSDSRIYAANGDEYVIDDVAVALGDVLAGGGIDNVILYVHGRGCGGGGEPGKSLAEVMPSLESDYDAKALMFNWPGSDVGCPLGFPEAEARAAGPAFAHVLKKLAFWASTHPEALSGVKLTLIPHSMGSFLLEEAMVTDDSPLPGQLFDTVVIQSSATARAGHHAWLASVTFSPNVYVSLNDGDTVLTAASVLGGVRLGKNVDGATLASNAIYVDFTLASVNHAYYLHSGQDGQPMTGFYDTVMNGNAYDFASSTGIASVEARDGTFIYVFEGN